MIGFDARFPEGIGDLNPGERNRLNRVVHPILRGPTALSQSRK
jgi:hypothetical protein